MPGRTCRASTGGTGRRDVQQVVWSLEMLKDIRGQARRVKNPGQPNQRRRQPVQRASTANTDSLIRVFERHNTTDISCEDVQHGLASWAYNLSGHMRGIREHFQLDAMPLGALHGFAYKPAIFRHAVAPSCAVLPETPTTPVEPSPRKRRESQSFRTDCFKKPLSFPISAKGARKFEPSAVFSSLWRQITWKGTPKNEIEGSSVGLTSSGSGCLHCRVVHSRPRSDVCNGPCPRGLSLPSRQHRYRGNRPNRRVLLFKCRRASAGTGADTMFCGDDGLSARPLFSGRSQRLSV